MPYPLLRICVYKFRQLYIFILCQQLFDETGGMAGSRNAGRICDAGEMEALENVIKPYDRDKGNPAIYYLTEDEKARWYDAIMPLY